MQVENTGGSIEVEKSQIISSEELDTMEFKKLKASVDKEFFLMEQGTFPYTNILYVFQALFKIIMWILIFQVTEYNVTHER
jgi:3-deoxy-D-manno-octulosonic acid (KDO) 8-phosphate synthase